MSSLLRITLAVPQPMGGTGQLSLGNCIPKITENWQGVRGRGPSKYFKETPYLPFFLLYKYINGHSYVLFGYKLPKDYSHKEKKLYQVII